MLPVSIDFGYYVVYDERVTYCVCNSELSDVHWRHMREGGGVRGRGGEERERAELILLLPVFSIS